MNEKTAIDLCLHRRDPRGFEFLFNQFRREAYYHAIGLLGNQEDAADACQEAFTKAFVAIRRLTRLDAFYPWFYTILRNHCLNLIKRRQTETHHNQHLSAIAPLALIETLPLERKQEQEQIWQTLMRLKPQFREILLMKYTENCNYDLLAKRLGIPRGTVMSRLYHARTAFKETYAALQEEEE